MTGEQAQRQRRFRRQRRTQRIGRSDHILCGHETRRPAGLAQRTPRAIKLAIQQVVGERIAETGTEPAVLVHRRKQRGVGIGETEHPVLVGHQQRAGAGQQQAGAARMARDDGQCRRGDVRQRLENPGTDQCIDGRAPALPGLHMRAFDADRPHAFVAACATQGLGQCLGSIGQRCLDAHDAQALAGVEQTHGRSSVRFRNLRGHGAERREPHAALGFDRRTRNLCGRMERDVRRLCRHRSERQRRRRFGTGRRSDSGRAGERQLAQHACCRRKRRCGGIRRDRCESDDGPNCRRRCLFNSGNGLRRRCRQRCPRTMRPGGDGLPVDLRAVGAVDFERDLPGTARQQRDLQGTPNNIGCGHAPGDIVERPVRVVARRVRALRCGQIERGQRHRR